MESAADRERKYGYLIKTTDSRSAVIGRRPPVYLEYDKDGKRKEKGGSHE